MQKELEGVNFFKFSTLAVWAISIIKTITYFSYFKITITRYLDFYEYVSIFIDSLSYYLIMIFLLFGYYSLVVNEKIFKFPENWKDKLYKYTLLAILFTPYVFIISTYIVLYLFEQNILIDLKLIITLIITIICTLICYLFIFSYKPFTTKSLIYILFLYFLVNYSILFNLIEIISVKISYKRSISSFELDKTSIQLDSTSYIIGNTKNYFFYYDGKRKETITYPMSRITKISSIPKEE